MNTQLMVKTGNRYRRATVSEVCETASGYLFSSHVGTLLANPKQAKDFLVCQGGMEHEQFGVIYLNNRHRVLRTEILFNGTIDGANVYPRQVVKAALTENAAAVIVFHNHPSGIAEPSHADENITRRLKDALGTVDIRLMDHLIIAKGSVTSFAERGLI